MVENAAHHAPPATPRPDRLRPRCLGHGRLPAAARRPGPGPRTAVPTLILEGEAAPFARIDLLRAAMPLLPRGHLVTFPRLAHGLLPVLDEALDAPVGGLGGGRGARRARGG